MAGLSVLTLTHTPPTAVDFRMEGKTFTHTSLTQIFLPLSCCCSPTRPERAVSSSRGLIVPLTHRNFWVLPRHSFSTKSWMLGLSKFRRAVFPHVCCKLYSLIHFGTVIFPRCWLCCRGLPYIFRAVVISFEESFWPR